MPHNEIKNPLMKVKTRESKYSISFCSPPAASVSITPESVLRGALLEHTEKTASEQLKPAKSETTDTGQEYSSKQVVAVKNSLPFKVCVCREFDIPVVDIVPGGEAKIDSLMETLLVAKMVGYRSDSIVSAYISYPGNATTWNIISFPTDSFLPSSWPDPSSNEKLQTASWEVEIINNLKTYVCIWQVLTNGSLHYIECMPQGVTIKANLCYVGTSLVATQGGTVISKFFADSVACTK